MDVYRGPISERLGAIVKRKRSQTLRRPRPQTQWSPQIHDPVLSSSFPLSDDASKVSSDDNTGDANSNGKMFNLNHCLSRGSSVSITENDYPYKRTKKEDGVSSVLYDNGYVLEGSSTPSNHSGILVDGAGNENKLKKVKLKLGGITRTIQTKSSSNGASGGGSSTKIARSSDSSRVRQKRVNQGNSDGDLSPSPDKKSGLQGASWKDFSKGGSNHRKEDMGKMPGKSTFERHREKSDPVRKSKRVPKRRLLDAAFDGEDDDDEIRYLEKLKSYKASGYKGIEEESNKKQNGLSRSGKSENMEDVGRSGKDGWKCRSDRGSEDTDYEEAEEVLSEGEPESKKKKKQKKDLSDSPAEIMREKTLTTRQRALLCSKDASSAFGGSQIEFPDGLPPPPPRKQKEKLSEVEQQLKKAEAAQRRRMQNEKAARESEAEAIRKILGQDASRKKREEQKKKRQEELAQGKAANAQILAGNTIRWVMGPTGTVVTFPQDMGLPKIFDPKSCTYPPPREKCAGPSCTNPYKYRDSKSKLPLCSLQCYKAIHEKMHAETVS